MPNKNEIDFLSEIKTHLPAFAHRWKTPFDNDDDDASKWIEEGKPYIWYPEIVGSFASLYSDISRGYLALVINGKIADVGKDFVSGEKGLVVGLGCSYTGSDYPGLYFRTATGNAD